MPLSFLAPAFLAGLVALAVPIIVHLANRPKKQVVRFPSLMFLERVEYQASSRRRLRNLVLFALRCLALILVAGAFARPFLDRPDAPPVVVEGGRELVVLLDRSASMAAGDRMERARAAAEEVTEGLARGDRATLVLFDRDAVAANRATDQVAVLRSAIDTVRPGGGATRMAPALRLAESILVGTPLPRRELVVISDFQRGAWDPTTGVRMPPGTEIRALQVGDPIDNAAVVEAGFGRDRFSGRDRVRVAARVVNRGQSELRTPVTLELDGRAVQERAVEIGAGDAASVSFDPVTLPDRPVRGLVRIAGDGLPADDAFRFTLSPTRSLRVLIVQPATGAAGPYLERALELGPEHDLARVPARNLDPGDLAGVDVVVLDGADFPQGATGQRIRALVEAGAGLVAVLGERSRAGSWDEAGSGLLPGVLKGTRDRAGVDGATLSTVRYDHPLFEPFRQPGAAGLTRARFYRYRELEPAAGGAVLARYDDGSVAVAVRVVEKGRVVALTSPLDGRWNDLVLQPSFLPFAHRLIRFASGREPEPEWRTVGEMLDIRRMVAGGSVAVADSEEDGGEVPEGARPVLLTPSDERIPIDADTALVPLHEAGFWEVRDPRRGGPPLVVAVNVDPAESDLRTMDPQEVVAGVTGAGPAPSFASFAPEDRERRQSLWWYFLGVAFLLMAVETALGNSLSRRRTAGIAARGVKA